MIATEKISSASSKLFIEPQALMRIKNLELRAKIVVEGFWNGLHRSPYHGFSVEFTEYRQYSPGDEPRYLDWKLFGRTDRYYIKKFEDETNLRCHLLVDNSHSMTFGSIGFTKSDYARTLAATLAHFLSMQGDAVGLITFDEKVRDYLPARNRVGHLRHLMLALEKPAEGRATNLAPPLQRVVEIVKKRGLIVFISDLLAPNEMLEKSLASLAACGHEVVVFQVLDPTETKFDFAKPSMFYDVESQREVYIDPEDIRRDYLKRFSSHNEQLQKTCEKLGVGFVQLITNQPLEMALFDFLRSRIERGKKVKRFRAAGRA